MKKRYCLLIAMMALFAQPLHAQTCRNDITPATPTQDFTLHDDGTATHHKTGLMWMRCALGQSWNGATCTGSGQIYRWSGALQAAEGFSFAGNSDWRLPNIKELGSIVEQACSDPAINTTIFPGAPLTSFWSASPYANRVYDAWYVDFSYGNLNTYSKTYGNVRVRLVRGGQ